MLKLKADSLVDIAVMCGNGQLEAKTGECIAEDPMFPVQMM
ncbi:hypothetical protein [Legionella tunisiensis]|nr:hypothetical protein [Legionella tunisiensis]